jgi:hypothetical protein
MMSDAGRHQHQVEKAVELGVRLLDSRSGTVSSVDCGSSCRVTRKKAAAPGTFDLDNDYATNAAWA